MPRTHQMVDSVKRSISLESGHGAKDEPLRCNICLRQFRESEGFVPFLDYTLAQQDASKYFALVIQHADPPPKFQLSDSPDDPNLKKEKIDYLKDQRNFQGLEGPEALPRFDFTDLPKLENINERKKFMDQHELSLRKMVDEDIRRHKKSVYSKFATAKMFRAMSSDRLYQKIVRNMQKDLIRYFETMNLQSNFRRDVEESQPGYQVKPVNSVLIQK